MMARLSLDSFLLVPMGKSDKEYDMCYTMLAAALQYTGPDREEKLVSAIDLIVEMRVDGVLIDLVNICKWNPDQGRHGDRVLHVYTKTAKAHIRAIFSDDSLNNPSAINGQLAGAMYCFWAMYDSAYDIVGNTVARASSPPLAIEKKSPPQDLA